MIFGIDEHLKLVGSIGMIIGGVILLGGSFYESLQWRRITREYAVKMAAYEEYMARQKNDPSIRPILPPPPLI